MLCRLDDATELREMERIIEVVGRADVKAPADTVVVTLTIEGENSTYEGALGCRLGELIR